MYIANMIGAFNDLHDVAVSKHSKKRIVAARPSAKK